MIVIDSDSGSGNSACLRFHVSHSYEYRNRLSKDDGDVTVAKVKMVAVVDERAKT